MSEYYSRLRKFEFTDILGWSYSRYNTFQQCKRKYYYEYYRKRDIENVAKIAVLRDLTTVPLEIGNISHKLIQALLSRLQKSAGEIDRDIQARVEERALRVVAAELERCDPHHLEPGLDSLQHVGHHDQEPLFEDLQRSAM